MQFIKRFTTWLFRDKRPQWVQDQERQFIATTNSLKAHSVGDRGGVALDPDGIRDLIIASREELKHLVHKPTKMALNDIAKPASDINQNSLDCIELVTWRLLPSGSAVRFVCLQSLATGMYAIAAANLFNDEADNLPPWVDANQSKQVANSLRTAELQWYGSAVAAMDAWTSI